MPAPNLNVFTDKRGRRRVTWKGRKGFPVMLRVDESPEDAYARTLAAEVAKAAGAATVKDAGPASDPAGPAPQPQDTARARPPGSDPKPAGGRPAGRPRIADAKIQQVFSELLSLPAIPMGMPVHDPALDQVVDGDGSPGGRLEPGFRPRCEFCRDHFIQQGPQTAVELVKLSQQSEALRRWMERVTVAWDNITTVGVLSAYAAKPVLHHLAPAPFVEGLGPVLGVPPRPPKPPRQRGRSHAHDAAAAQAGATAASSAA